MCSLVSFRFSFCGSFDVPCLGRSRPPTRLQRHWTAAHRNSGRNGEGSATKVLPPGAQATDSRHLHSADAAGSVPDTTLGFTRPPTAACPLLDCSDASSLRRPRPEGATSIQIMQPIELVYSIIDFLINLKDKFLLARLFCMKAVSIDTALLIRQVVEQGSKMANLHQSSQDFFLIQIPWCSTRQPPCTRADSEGHSLAAMRRTGGRPLPFQRQPCA